MLSAIESIKNTIALKKEQLKSDQVLTDELLVDDLVKALGYNKRTDDCVKRRVSKDIDWEITGEAGSLMIKTYPYGYDFTTEEITRVADVCKEHNYNFAILTDGEKVIVMCVRYTIPGNITFAIEDNNAEQMIGLLSSTQLDDSALKEEYYDKNMSLELIDKTIEILADELTDVVACKLDCPNTKDLYYRIKKRVVPSLNEHNKLEVENGTVSEQKKDSEDEEDSIDEDATSDDANDDSESDDILDDQDSEVSYDETAETTIESGMSPELAEELRESKEEALKTLEGLRQQLQEALSEKEQATEAVEESEKEIEKLRGLVESLQEELKESQDTVENLKKELEEQMSSEDTEDLLGDDSDESDTSFDTEDGIKEAKIAELKELLRQSEERASSLDLALQSMTEEYYSLKANNNVELDEESKEIVKQSIEAAQEIIKNMGDAAMRDGASKIPEYMMQLETSLANSNARYTQLFNEKEAVDKELEGTKEELGNVQKLLETTQDSLDRALREKEEVSKKYNDIQDSYDTVIQNMATQRERINELEQKLADGGSNLKLEESYRSKIDELTKDLAAAREEALNLRDELKEKQEEIEKLQVDTTEEANRRLALIDDSDEMGRSYVGVFGTEVFQKEKLELFVGAFLQKLFEVKGLPGMDIMFDGDYFRLTKASENVDCIINNTYYRVNLEGVSEDEALNKLRVLFNHFDDIPFACKKIGNLNFREESSEAVDDYSTLDDSEYNYQEYQQNEVLTYVSMGSLDAFDYFVNGDVPISKLCYVSGENMAFKIYDEETEYYPNSVVASGIAAIIMLAYYSNPDLDFSYLSNLDGLADEVVLASRAPQDAAQIVGTRYSVCNVHDNIQGLRILEEMYRRVMNTQNQVWVLVKVAEGYSDIVGDVLDEQAVALVENVVPQYEEGTEPEKTRTLLSEAMIESLPYLYYIETPPINLISQIKAIKYHGKAFEGTNEENISKCFAFLIGLALENGSDGSFEELGTLPDGETPMLTTDPDVAKKYNDCQEVNVETSNGNLVYYRPRLSTLQMIDIMSSLKEIYIEKPVGKQGDTYLIFNVVLDLRDLEFYATQFISYDPLETCGVVACAKYILGKVKK